MKFLILPIFKLEFTGVTIRKTCSDSVQAFLLEGLDF